MQPIEKETDISDNLLDAIQKIELDEKIRSAELIKKSRPIIFGNVTLHWDGLINYLYNIFSNLAWVFYGKNVTQNNNKKPDIAAQLNNLKNKNKK